MAIFLWEANIKMVQVKKGGREWPALLWLSIGTKHRILQTAPTFRYNKKLLVSSLTEQISGSQAGPYSMWLVQDYANEASTL